VQQPKTRSMTLPLLIFAAVIFWMSLCIWWAANPEPTQPTATQSTQPVSTQPESVYVDCTPGKGYTVEPLQGKICIVAAPKPASLGLDTGGTASSRLSSHGTFDPKPRTAKVAAVEDAARRPANTVWITCNRELTSDSPGGIHTGSVVEGDTVTMLEHDYWGAKVRNNRKEVGWVHPARCISTVKP
jgi:hypothetical protein